MSDPDEGVIDEGAGGEAVDVEHFFLSPVL
jgi:hypothetical protein